MNAPWLLSGRPRREISQLERERDDARETVEELRWQIQVLTRKLDELERAVGEKR